MFTGDQSGKCISVSIKKSGVMFEVEEGDLLLEENCVNGAMNVDHKPSRTDHVPNINFAPLKGPHLQCLEGERMPFVLIQTGNIYEERTKISL